MAFSGKSSSSLFVNGSGDVEVDDDSISITSTAPSEHDEDEEFIVDAVVAERPHEDSTRGGEMQYLIQWEGYPLDRSTWEGADHLSDELLQEWQERRQLEIQGKRRPFNVHLFERALADAERCKEAKHRLRNDKRRRLGMPMTPPFPGDHGIFAADEDQSDSSDEALEVGMDMADASPQQRKMKQTTFKGIASSIPQNKAATPIWQGTARKPLDHRADCIKPGNVSAKAPLAASSASLASKFGKRLKATRSAPRPTQSRPTTTVPKARKARVTLKDVMMDPTKPAKHMTNMRRVNQLRKKGLELNDAAPLDPSTIPAGYFVTADPPQRISGSDNSHVRTVARGLPSAIASSVGDSDRPRSKKTVRFAEDSTVAANMQQGLNTGPHDPATHSLPMKRKVSLDSYKRTATHQTISKTASFGCDAAREILIEFRDLPRNATTIWLSHFVNEQTLKFQAVCTAADFFSPNSLYDAQDSRANLASGRLESPTSTAALDTVASNLRRSSSALYIPYLDYSVLVYPGHCPDWSPITNTVPATPDTLMYLIFKPNCTVNPVHYPALSNTTAGTANISADLRMKMMDSLAEFDYGRLLAPSAGKKHVFFLLFHTTDISAFHVVLMWLRACKPDCQIYHNEEAGSWESFQKATDSGAVILHESVERNIRSVPNLWHMLKYGAHTFWSLSSSNHETPMKLSGHDSQFVSGFPAQLQLRLLFPGGRAFLLAPSFLISQPRKLCTFLEWFKKRTAIAPGVLVVCDDFPRYFLNVAIEKAQESDVLLGNNWNDHQANSLAGAKGLSREDHKARVRAWELINELVDPVSSEYKSYEEPPEDIRKVVYADSLIAPDDEQSLVNWFAAWSMTRLDTYRKFYVLGSSVDKKARRMVCVPNYSPGVVNEPDKKIVKNAEPITILHEIRGQASRGDRPEDFQSWFGKFDRRLVSSLFCLHYAPISWVDTAMADRHGDILLNFDTYSQWLRSSNLFPNRTNTLVGFFYTTTGSPEEASTSSSAARHPWIAILRPVNPHLGASSFAAMELLIWDYAGKEQPRKISRQQLLPMQRELIDLVRQELPTMNSKYHLNRVWVGGWKIEVDADRQCPLDVTTKTLEAFVNGIDGRTKYLPPSEWKMSKAGWEILNEDGFSICPLPTKIDRSPDDDDEPERLIFHPPSGTVGLDGRSRYTNNLYDAALRARKADPRCQKFDYQFQMTTDWYQILVDERRSYNHIYVEAWHRVFKDSEINN